jgi:hypothetical protein
MLFFKVAKRFCFPVLKRCDTKPFLFHFQPHFQMVRAVFHKLGSGDLVVTVLCYVNTSERIVVIAHILYNFENEP